jgi:hypothetical protein
LAVFGKELSPWEICCKQVYNIQWLMNNIDSKSLQKIGVKPEQLYQEAEKQFKELIKVVSDVFVTALLNHDKKTILELANAAEFFKGKIGMAQEVEPVCAKLLMLKATYNIHKGMTIREIAEFVYGKGVAPRTDGYSHLRQLCKKLGLPIKPSRVEVKKTGVTRF